MNLQEVRVGVQVRVGEHHRIGARRRMVGRVVGRYGGDDYVAVDVCVADGRCRLFWPEVPLGQRRLRLEQLGRKKRKDRR